MRNQLLGGRYRILDRIGEGGMAYVYVALDEKLGRRVAIKVLHEHMERNEDIRKRFKLEAQAVSALDHPNIVKIHDFSGAGSERLWIVTEVIDGKNLAQFVEEYPNGELNAYLASFIVREIAKALERAHAQGIVHRDIKPENIMITRTGRVKLMDFGIAKDLAKSNITLTGTFMGSPSYMSPEQVRGRDVDYRSDLYSLSVLFYEIVTGRLPFTGQTTHDVVLKIMDGKFTYPRYIVPSIPDMIDRLIVTGMAMNPAARIQTATEYGTLLDQFLEASGMLESHMELERYFKNRKEFEKRLRQIQFGDGKSTTFPAVPPDQRAEPRKPARTSRTRPGAPSPFRQDNTWQKHIPARPKTTADSTARRSTRATRSTRLDSLPLRSEGTNLVPAATALLNSRAGGTPAFLPAPPPNTRAKAEAQARAEALAQQQLLAQQRSAEAQGNPLLPSPQPNIVQARDALVRERMQRAYRMSTPRNARYHVGGGSPTPGWLAGFFGFLLVAGIGAIAIWGFWELSERIDSGRAPIRIETIEKVDKQDPSEATSQSTPTKIKPRRKPRPFRTVKVQPAPQEQVVAPRKETTKRKPKSVAQKTTRRPVKTKAKVIQRTEPETGLIVETSEIAIDKPDTPEVSVPEITPSPIPVEISKKESAPEKLDASEPAQVSFKSKPAAEVYIDGMRLGTTIDATTTSGWLSVQSGERSLELRRDGYETYRRTITLKAGDKRQFPLISLKPASEENLTYTLTIVADPVPATVTIRNMDQNQTNAFAMKSATKSVDLPSGRYQVKVKYGNATKERHIVLSGKQRNLTFTAEFKEE